MRPSFYLLFLLIVLGCQHSNKKVKNAAVPKEATSKTNPDYPTIDTFLLGDINADKVIDKAFITNPKFVNPKNPLDGGCVNKECNVTIQFSCALPPIHFDKAIGGSIYNIGDVNNDGLCELVFIPNWFQGSWATMHFYSLQNSTWKEFGTARTLGLPDAIDKRITIINKHTIEVLEDVTKEDGSAIVIQKRKLIKLGK